MFTIERMEETTLSNGNVIKYKVVNGTFYRASTPMKVVTILENARMNNTRVRLFMGDAETGRDWGEEYDTMGYVGRTTGLNQVPILVSNRSSMGGGAILDDCIVRITIDKRTVWQHEHYHLPFYSIHSVADMRAKDLEAEGYTHMVFADGKNVANFRSHDKADRWVNFMVGKRNAK